MKPEFKNISQYLSYKTTCPFCYQDLDVNVISSLASSLSGNHQFNNTELKHDGLHYNLSTIIHGSYDNYHITLRKNGILSYSRENPKINDYPIDKRRFIEAFNHSYAQISQSCVNKNCALEFFKESLPLYLDEKSLHSPELYRESFTFNNYFIQNNYADDITEVYIKNSSLPPIIMALYELTEKSTPLIFDRVKVALVFS